MPTKGRRKEKHPSDAVILALNETVKDTKELATEEDLHVALKGRCGYYQRINRL